MVKNWAISIGVNDYKNLPTLRFAVRDAECMKEWFEKEAGFKKVYLFTDNSEPIKDSSKPFDSQPTFATLIRFLDDRFEKPFLSSGDNLWFFFSGHGLRYGDRDYLMLSDSSAKGNLIEKTAISLSYVTERLRRAGADNVIVVQDACRNEGASKGAGIGFEKYKGVITISSCSPSERSFEIEERQNGSFTSVLLESLRGEHGNCATVERLNQCLSIQVPELNKKYKKESQTPYVITEPLCKSQLILLPSMATLDDVKGLKLEAYKAEHDNLSLAKILMNQVLIASPADVDALNWYRKIWRNELVSEHKIEILIIEKSYKKQIEDLEKNHDKQIKELESSYNEKVKELQQSYENIIQEQDAKEKLSNEQLAELKSSYKQEKQNLEGAFQSKIKRLQQQLQQERYQVAKLTKKLQSTTRQVSSLKDTEASIKKKTNTKVKLNEFSTGIRFMSDADGSWFSVGFTGQYMNVTDSIPNPIQGSIANREFAVAEGASSDQPAIIGRVIQGVNNEAWSVVAIASRGWDEKGRSFSCYRYLWCDGDNGLSKILAWIDNYREHYRQFPVFDPFKTVVEKNAYLSNNGTEETPPSEFLYFSVPIIIKPNQSYTLKQIHALAKQKASGQPVSWSYNAEALEQPWDFVVIQAASDVAYERFRRVIANAPKSQKSVVANEYALRLAIKSLMGSSTVKQEVIEEIMTAIKNKEITKDYWHSFFDSQGARNALSQKIYSPQMIRLLTLRTLVIPDTFSDYFNWLQINNNFQERNINQAIAGSLEFQSKLRPILTKYPQITEKIEYFIKWLRKESIPTKYWERIGDYIKEHIYDFTLATFYYKLAALFEQDNTGSVNEQLFIKAFGSPNPSIGKFLDITIKKKEKKSLKTKFILIGISAFLGSVGIYYIRMLMVPVPIPNPTYSEQTQNQNLVVPDMIERRGIVKFRQTVEAIKLLQTELMNQGKTQQAAIQDIKEVLGHNGKFVLDWKIIEDQLMKGSLEYEHAQKQWIEAIYEYQKSKNLQNADGYISPGQGTFKQLAEDINLPHKIFPTP